MDMCIITSSGVFISELKYATSTCGLFLALEKALEDISSLKMHSYFQNNMGSVKSLNSFQKSKICKCPIVMLYIRISPPKYDFTARVLCSVLEFYNLPYYTRIQTFFITPRIVDCFSKESKNESTVDRGIN